MGYRSDVVRAIAFDTIDSVTAFVAMQRLESNEILIEALSDFKITEVVSKHEKLFIVWAMWADIKWYDSYPYINAVEALVATAQAAGWCTVSMHIGEETEDVECTIREGERDSEDMFTYEVLCDMFGLTQALRYPEIEGRTPLPLIGKGGAQDAEVKA